MNSTEKYIAWVRPAVTIMFSGAFVYLAIIGTVPSDAFVATSTAILMFWFKSRDDQKG